MPEALHHYLEFAEKAISTRQEILEDGFKRRAASCRHVDELRALASESRGTIPAESAIHKMVADAIERRCEAIRFDIQTMYDHPLVDGSVPFLERAAKRYLSELPPEDPKLRDFLVNICFLELHYKNQLRIDFDPRHELKTFSWCDLLGAHHVLPLFVDHSTPLELKEIYNAMMSRYFELDSDSIEAAEVKRVHRYRLVRAGRACKVVGLDEVSSSGDEPEFDVWDMLGDNFVLDASDSRLKRSVESEPQPAAPSQRPVAREVTIPGQPILDASHPTRDWTFDECIKSCDQYTFFDGPPKLRHSFPISQYKVTRFPSHAVVLRPTGV